jgi:hypothetical protein
MVIFGASLDLSMLRSYRVSPTINTFTLFSSVSFVTMLLMILSARSEVNLIQLTEQEFMKRQKVSFPVLEEFVPVFRSIKRLRSLKSP